MNIHTIGFGSWCGGSFPERCLLLSWTALQIARLEKPEGFDTFSAREKLHLPRTRAKRALCRKAKFWMGIRNTTYMVRRRLLAHRKRGGAINDTIFGIPGTKDARKKFCRYLDRGGTPIDKWFTEGFVHFYKSLPELWREMMVKRMKAKEPERMKKWVSFVHKTTNKKKARAKFLQRRREEEDKLAVETEVLDKGVRMFRFVPSDTVKNMCSALVASGYTHAEVGEKLGLPVEVVRQHATTDMVTKMRRSLPELIVEAGNQRVYKDMLDGMVTDTTIATDKIVERRQKTMIEAAKLRHEMTKRPPMIEGEVEEVKRASYRDRFGVSVAETPIGKEKSKE